MEDRSELFNQLKNFSQRKLKKVETKVVTASGEQLVEKRGAKGLQVLTGNADAKGQEAEPARKLDLQVGLILPGFIIGSQDVAHDKKSLDDYGVTHILNLDAGIENKFEDDYNYKNLNMQDSPDYNLEKVLEDCFDFIEDGRHYGNVLIHCSGTIGLSRSTTICIAYLMSKEKQKFDEAFNNVKEARSFVKPNEGFVKQLRDYEVKLRGAQQVKDSGIDDPFALRKKQEIEQEKAMVAGAASVKNRMKMFGATLDTNSAAASRSKSVSPAPGKASPASAATPSATSKWSTSKQEPASKSMTPEPRKSWQVKPQEPANDWRSSSSANKAPGGPPPPPPPMPTNLSRDDNKSTVNRSSAALPPPPPPPPPPTGDLPRGPSAAPTHPQATSKLSANKFSSQHQAGNTNSSNGGSPASGDDSGDRSRMVFGRVRPPPMKIVGGLSIERNDPTSDKNLGYSSSNKYSNTNQPSKTSLQLPLKKQFTSDSTGSDGESNQTTGENPRAPSPSAALRAAKQQAAGKQAGATTGSDHRGSVSGQLNRSSTKKLLNLIKTKTRSDLTLPDGDENDEIEALLGALESESIDNIDWDELGLDEDEVKEIIKKGAELSSDDDDSSSSEEEGTEEEEEEEEVETSTQHFVIRTK